MVAEDCDAQGSAAQMLLAFGYSDGRLQVALQTRQCARWALHSIDELDAQSTAEQRKNLPQCIALAWSLVSRSPAPPRARLRDVISKSELQWGERQVLELARSGSASMCSLQWFVLKRVRTVLKCAVQNAVCLIGTLCLLHGVQRPGPQ